MDEHSYTYLAKDPSDPTSFVTKTEALLEYAATAVVSRRMLEKEPQVVTEHTARMLTEKLNDDLKRQGRVKHGQMRMDHHEDYPRDAVVFRLSVLTRRSQEGQWPSIWAAYEQDEEDRREALRHSADDVED